MIKRIFFISICLFIIVSIVIVIVIQQNQSNHQQTNIPSANNTGIDSGISNIISPLQKFPIGAKNNHLDSVPGFKDKQTLPDGSVQYDYESPLSIRPNIIITKDDSIIYERELTPEQPSEKGYAIISDYLNRFGQPDVIVQGSHFYDWMAKTYIYARRGFAFIGNPNTDEVYEFQFFKPMSSEDYIKNYGEDLNPSSGPKPE